MKEYIVKIIAQTDKSKYIDDAMEALGYEVPQKGCAYTFVFRSNTEKSLKEITEDIRKINEETGLFILEIKVAVFDE